MSEPGVPADRSEAVRPNVVVLDEDYDGLDPYAGLDAELRDTLDAVDLRATLAAELAAAHKRQWRSLLEDAGFEVRNSTEVDDLSLDSIVVSTDDDDHGHDDA